MSEDRRHAAIVFTDIVGYTALMGSDEDRAFETLRLNREIHSQYIAQYNGTLIKEMGDGMLISFHLASEAVRCAIEIQKVCKEKDIPLKIGIHEGEMVFAGNDVLGNGVNIASSLQEGAPEGCINISASIYRDIKNKADIKTNFVEEKTFKNVDKQIKVYNVKIDENEESSETKDQTSYKKQFPENKYIQIGTLIFLVILAVILIWKFDDWTEPTSFKEIGRTFVKSKSVAVLPFLNLSNDPKQDYFSDGMADEILNHLNKIGDLNVISRTSSMRYKGSDQSVKEIAKELGVISILEGNVKKEGSELHIMARLKEAETGTVLWSDTYEGDLSQVFLFQSRIAQHVAENLKAILSSRETELILKIPNTNSLAYDFFLQGNDYWRSKNDLKISLDMYSKSIKQDSLFARAYGRRAYMYFLLAELKQLKLEDGGRYYEHLAFQDIRKGFQLDPESLEVKFADAVSYYIYFHRYNESIHKLNELKLDIPGMADLYAYVSYNLRQDKLNESIIEMKEAISLDPFNADYTNSLCETYYFLRNYDLVIEYARYGLLFAPDNDLFKKHVFHAFLNKTGDLKAAIEESHIKKENHQYEIYLYTRQYDKLIDFLNNKFIPIINERSYRLQNYELARINYLKGNMTLSKIYADSVISYFENNMILIPSDTRINSIIGKCFAFGGMAKEAIFFGKNAVKQPYRKDAYQDPLREQDLMEIYIITGKFDLAFDKIEYLLSIPSSLSVGCLLVDPIFDNLRHLSRFQRIIALSTP